MRATAAITRFLCMTILAPTTASLASAQTALEEVVVLAQRVQESAQDTPLSLAVLDSASMAALGIYSVDNIAGNVPGFVVDSFPSSNQTLRLFIRGVGITDVQITQDPAVGVYLDGVYLARSSGLASELADLERIEILRGPQGTLYGRNTTGGALNLITSRPDPANHALKVDLGAGDRNLLRARSSLNLPVSANAAIKLAALYREKDGFIDNTGPGGNFGDAVASGYRLDWRWRPHPTLTVDYSWNSSRVESYNYTPQAVLPGMTTGTPADAAIVSSQRFVPYAERRLDQLATSVPLQPNDTDIEGHALQIGWELKDFTVRSISAWRQLDDDSYIDFASGASAEYRLDFGAVTLGAQGSGQQHYDETRTRLQQRQFSQELQLIGPLGDTLDLVAGGYFFREEAEENWFPLHHIFSFPVIASDDQAVAVNLRAEDNRIDNRAVATYAQLTWSPIADWAFTLGWRYTRDTRDVRRLFRQENYVDFGNAVLGPFEQIDFRARASKRFSDNAFSFIIQYQPGEDTMLYAKLAEAYKSGGFNTRDPDPIFFSQGFDEEKNRTLEIGMKSEWLQRALRVNSALFYSRFSDMQLNFLLPGTLSDTRVFNSGAARLAGLELEMVAMPVHGLLARLNYAYLHSAIDDVDDPFSGSPRAFGFSNAPGHSASFNLDYQFPPWSAGTLSANINYTYTDERDTDSPFNVIDAHQLLGARLTLSEIDMPQGELTVSAWVSNLLDEEYVTFTIDNLPHASRAVLWGEPRSWGLDIRFRY